MSNVLARVLISAATADSFNLAYLLVLRSSPGRAKPRSLRSLRYLSVDGVFIVEIHCLSIRFSICAGQAALRSLRALRPPRLCCFSCGAVVFLAVSVRLPKIFEKSTHQKEPFQKLSGGGRGAPVWTPLTRQTQIFIFHSKNKLSLSTANL